MQRIFRGLVAALLLFGVWSLAPASALAAFSDQLDNPYLTFTTGGDDGVTWVEVNGLGHPGGDADCARSGHIADLDPLLPFYWKVTSVGTSVVGPGEISFWWKVDTAFSHELEFQLGGARFPTWISQSGVQDWQHFSGDVPAGTYTLTWAYMKDNLFPGAGGDCVWIDDVQYLPDDRPTGSMTVNDGAGYTLDTVVTARSTVNGATAMRFAATSGAAPQAGDWSSWSVYGETRSVTLPWGDGSRRVFAEYRNAYGAVLALQDDIVLDLTAPQITSLSSPTHPSPDDPVPDDDPRFTWTASDASGIAGFSCALDSSSGGSPDEELDGGGSSIAYTDVLPGVLYFHLRVRDNAGRWSDVSQLRIWVVSSGAPSVLSLTSSSHPDPDQWWPEAGVALAWSSSDPAATAGYSWAFDASPTTVPDDTVDTTDTILNLPGQADGTHYFHVKARSVGGVWGTTEHRRVRIDTTTPAVFDMTSSSHPSEDAWYGATTASFSWGASGGPSGLSYSWSLDQSPGGTPDATVDGSSPGAVVSGVGEGTWYFHVKAHSGAGLWSGTITRRVRVDSLPPSVTGLVCSPQADETSWYAANDVRFTWSSTDGGSGVTGYSWVVDQSATTDADTSVDGAVAEATRNDLADGVWYVHVRAVDAAGHWSPTTHRRIQIDTAGPSMVSLTSPTHPDDGTWWDRTSVTLEWAAADSGSGVTGYSWVLDQTPSTTPDETVDGGGGGTTIAGVADGEWWAHVRCRDGAGTWSATLHRRIRIDATGPVVSGLASTTHPVESRWYRATTASFTWSATDAVGVAGYLWAIDQDPATVPGGDPLGTPSMQVPGLTDGVWYFHVRGRDGLGHEGVTVHRAVRIDTHGPTTFAPSSPSVRKGAYATLRYRVTDPLPNGGTAKVRIEIRNRSGRLVVGKTFSTLKPLDTTLSWRVRCSWARGTYRYKVLAWDAAGNRQVRAGSNRLVVR
jgi:hypothetical protein